MALRQFGELEAQVMDRVWRHNRPVLVRDILYDVNANRELAYTTVLTVMERLCRKGWLRRQRRGRAHAYEAVASREHYTAQLMCEALATSSNRTVSFVHFLEQLSTEENQALRTALEVRRLLADQPTDEDA